MELRRCVLCGRSASSVPLTSVGGLKGWVCRDGRGCDRPDPPGATPGAPHGINDPSLNEIYVDNPHHGKGPDRSH